MSKRPVHVLFWAKTDRKNPESEWIRPLWSHLIDVAVVAEVLWDRVLPASFKHDAAVSLGCTEDQARSFLCFMAGMHDVGKAIPSFQYLHVPSRERLEAVDLEFPKKLLARSKDAARVHHAHASHALLRTWYSKRSPSSEAVFGQLAFLLCLHHSKSTTMSSSRSRTTDKHGETDSWGRAQRDLIDCIVDILDPYIPDGMVTTTWHSWTYLFLGLVTYADWIASIDDENGFPLHDGDDLHAYLPIARAHASSLVEHLHIAHTADIVPRDFGEIFVDASGQPFVPNALQQAIIDLMAGDADPAPSMTIVEAPTGGGKTEASLYMALRQQVRKGGRGIYVALPTQATSNGLFPRFEQALSHSHRTGSFVNTLLVHGHSNLDPRQEELVRRFSLPGRMEEIMEKDDDLPGKPSVNAIVATASWFLPKKRSLLAPYGIGTIDQTLLAVMQSRFFFLRLLGLAGKTVIFDEVHAYDYYMLTLLCMLVRWLRAMGSDVIILSATLPGPTKKKLLDAWTGATVIVEGTGSHYPALTTVRNDKVMTHELPKPSPRRVHLKYLDPDPTHQAVVEHALEAYRAGCAVAIICNTVDRSIETFRMLLDNAEWPVSEAQSLGSFILHSRMTHDLRSGKEDGILQRFGKDYQGDRKGIVVGTQILEQSLDIDFDVMFSDIAPIDLLIQRAGRIHRHSHRHRPPGYEQPTLHVVMPAGDSPDPSFRSIAAVYDQAIMLGTYGLLRTIDSFESPTDIRGMIGRVYDGVVNKLDEGAELSRKEEKTLLDYEAMIAISGQMADKFLIHAPEHASSIMEGLPLLDDEAMENGMRARTRLSDSSIRVLCLHADDEGRWFLDPELRRPFNDDLLATTAGIREALGNEAPISRKAVVHALRDMMKDEEEDDDVRYWKTLADLCPPLGYLRPLIFNDLVWEAGDGSCRIRFDEVVGLVVSK